MGSNWVPFFKLGAFPSIPLTVRCKSELWAWDRFRFWLSYRSILSEISFWTQRVCMGLDSIVIVMRACSWKLVSRLRRSLILHSWMPSKSVQITWSQLSRWGRGEKLRACAASSAGVSSLVTVSDRTKPIKQDMMYKWDCNFTKMIHSLLKLWWW